MPWSHPSSWSVSLPSAKTVNQPIVLEIPIHHQVRLHATPALCGQHVFESLSRLSVYFASSTSSSTVAAFPLPLACGLLAAAVEYCAAPCDGGSPLAHPAVLPWPFCSLSWPSLTIFEPEPHTGRVCGWRSSERRSGFEDVSWGIICDPSWLLLCPA